VRCFIGVDYCDSQAHISSILVILAMLITRVLVIIFLKFSEGANYLVIIMVSTDVFWHSLSRVVVPAMLHSISVNAHFTRFL